MKIGEVVRRTPRLLIDEVLIVDDGSTDRSAEVARALGATVLPLGGTIGVGAALRAGYRYAVEHRYDVAVVMAGNNKDAPEEIPLLLDPIADGRADFVQGSRFLKGDADFGHMPRYRRIATRLHPLLFSLAARRWVTESTNGFRAVHRRVLTRDADRLALVGVGCREGRVGPEAEPALSDPEVAAVAGATPTSTHHRLVKTAPEHGKHVLVEKPTTPAVDQAGELRSLAERA